MTGRHVGVFAGRHPTSLVVPSHGMGTFRLGNGRIVESAISKTVTDSGMKRASTKVPTAYVRLKRQYEPVEVEDPSLEVILEPSRPGLILPA